MSELILISAADRESLRTEIRRVIDFVNRVPDVSLLDVAYTCSLKRGPEVLAVIASDVVGLRDRLVSAWNRLDSATMKRLRDKSGTYYTTERLLGSERGKLAFLYPGVMGFYPDMMRDLIIEHPVCRGAFDELEEALVGDVHFTPSSFVFPPAPYYRHDADIFKSGAYAQALVATYTGCVALTRLLGSFGVSPDGVVGFAGGDLAAMMRSGSAGSAVQRPNRIKMIRDIYSIVHKAVNHGGLPQVTMLSVLLRQAGDIDGIVRSFPPDKVAIAVDFSPRQKTFAVARDFVPVIQEAFSAVGARTRVLPLDRPFNTPLCASLVPVVRKFAAEWMKDVPTCDVYSCACAEKVCGALKQMRDESADRWANPVRFTETIRRMYADGYRVFLEVGPRGLMTAAVDDTLKGELHAAVALNSIHRSGQLQFQHAIGQLMALGADMDVSPSYLRRGARKISFDDAISLEVRRDSEMPLSRNFPKLTLISGEAALRGKDFLSEAKGRGAKAAARAAVMAQKVRKQRQFDFGAMNPLISDADIVASSPGVSIELSKDFVVADLPFIGDYALGTSQMSYSDPNLKGLIPLTLSLAAEIMAEAASMVMPNRNVLRVENLSTLRMVTFEKMHTRLFIHAERIAAAAPNESAIRVRIRDDVKDAAFTWPAMEGVIVLSESMNVSEAVSVEPLTKPRSVHWSGRDIYPTRLCYGKRLRGVQFVEAWGDSGLDYEIVVPPLSDAVSFTRFPMWVVNPLLLEIVVSGFALWRSHEKFTGAFSFPFRMRQLKFCGCLPNEGSRLKCYMRLTGVTPKSHLCELAVTDGNGKEIIAISGWEELTERVPNEYRALILQPATSYLTESLAPDMIGRPATDVATALVTDVPYAIFERNDELWLKTLSHVILDASERREFAVMTGSTARRTEWLFGRVAAKEAVRRFMNEYYQARWSNADVRIWPDDMGKPHALGAWDNFLATKIDIAIAHTARFVLAIAAANARAGVDVELASRDLSEEFATGVFTHEELELAAQSSNSSQTLIRFWCAKEAVSKALGTGIRYAPKEMVVADYQSDVDVLVIRLVGAWAEAFKNLRGRDITVTVRLMREHVLALCFIPMTLFNED